MGIVGNHPLIYDRRIDSYRDTEAGARMKCCCDCGSIDASSLWCTHESKDSRFVRWYDEVDHERPLGPIVVAHL